nr:hypothetical protein [bacterium]
MPSGNKVKFRRKTALLFLAVAAAGWSCGGPEAPRPGEKGEDLVPERTARVDYVIDGDTLILEDGERIRFLG